MTFRERAEDLGLEEEEYRELVELFLETSGAELEALQYAVAQWVPEQVAERAHSIKGAAGNLGFMDIYHSAGALEELGRSKRPDNLERELLTLREQIGRLAEGF